jgi:hypothetical protein
MSRNRNTADKKGGNNDALNIVTDTISGMSGDAVDFMGAFFGVPQAEAAAAATAAAAAATASATIADNESEARSTEAIGMSLVASALIGVVGFIAYNALKR